MLQWISDHQWLMWLSGVGSVVIFVASLFIVPAVLARIRPDYFAHDERPPSRWINHSRGVQMVLHIGKNVLGAVLMIAGLAMLALPGPGLVTALVGFLMIDFPGKYRFERWLMSRRWVAGPVNWLRHRAGRAPLTVR